MKFPALAVLSLLFGLLFGFFPQAVSAAPPEEPLSLAQALQKAAAGNLDLRKERINIEIAGATLLAARGRFDFVFSGALNFRRTTQPSLTAEDIVGGYTNDLGVDVGISRQLETGGNLRLSLQTDAFNTSSRIQCGLPSGSVGDCTYYSSTFGLTFTHPLLRGFGTEIAQANVRRQLVQQNLALLDRQTRASNVLRDVVTSYWELAYATQDLAIRRSAVELAQEQLRITKAQIEVGRLAPVASSAVERAIGERLQEVVLSEQNLFFRSLDLRRLMGMIVDPNQPLFSAQVAPTATPREVNVAAEVDRALQSNPQLRRLKAGLQLTEIDIQTALNVVQPQVDFVGTLGSQGRKNDLFETLSQTAGLDNLTWSAGLNFQAPLENRAAKGLLRASRLEGELARLDAGQFAMLLRETVMRYSSNIRTASRRVELARQTVGFAQQNLDAEQARFQVGRSTNNDVLLRQQELKNSEIQVVRATVDLLNSEAALSTVTAEILERNGVTLRTN
jgi:outer membrane protein